MTLKCNCGYIDDIFYANIPDDAAFGITLIGEKLFFFYLIPRFADYKADSDVYYREVKFCPWCGSEVRVKK